MRHLVFGNEEIVEEAFSSSTIRADCDSASTEDDQKNSSSRSEIVSIAKLIQDKERKREKFMSLELFPSKKGDNEVYKRFFSEVSECSSPLFYALTWHDNRPSDGNYLPLEILREFPNNTLLHLAGKKLSKFEVVKILNNVIAQKINNIFVLRGDDYTTTGDFPHASDLVKFIRNHYGSKFDICVAGYPQMHPESASKEEDLMYLKEKVDAGANFIISQIFFDSKVFVEFVKNCRSFGIKVPIIPGIFPIPNYKSLEKMATLCSVEIPSRLLHDLQPIKDNDEIVRAYGISLARKLIVEIFESRAANGFHLFTLNRASIALDVCRKLFK